MSCRPILYYFCFVIIAEFLRFCRCEIYIFSLLGFSFSRFIYDCLLYCGQFFLWISGLSLENWSI